MWNEYVDSRLQNPRGYFTIHSTTSTALIYKAVSPTLANQVRRDRDIYFFRVHQWWPVSHMSGPQSSRTCGPLIIYIWDHATTRPRGGVEVCPARPYLDLWQYTHIHSCIWIYLDKETTGPIYISYIYMGPGWSWFHMLDPYCYLLEKNNVSIQSPLITTYDT